MGNAYGIESVRERDMYQARQRGSNSHDIDPEYGQTQGRTCTKDKCKNCCKSFTAFLFSTVGLVLMVVAYSTAGGFLFRMLEEDKEREDILVARDIVYNSTERYLNELWNITENFNVLWPENWTEAAKNILIKYQDELYAATKEKYWDGRQKGEEVSTKWNFAGALLYAVTAITTIGYGHVTPKTAWGMLATIMYAVFGLPLTLMCIANLGKLFARIFRILYHACCCGICCICCLSYRRKRATKKLAKSFSSNNVTPGTLEVLGNGKPLSISNDPNATPSKRKPNVHISLSKAQVWLLNVRKKFSHSMRDDVTVPVYLCLVVMAAYIMGGAMLFSLYDGWPYLVGAYFCFVTLTTIGFGDYVPGIVSAGNTSDNSSTERLVVCTLYVFIGLALVGMCIDLMQADVKQKVMWIAQKVGIIGKENKRDLSEDVVKRKRSSTKTESYDKHELESEQLLTVDIEDATPYKHSPKSSLKKVNGRSKPTKDTTELNAYTDSSKSSGKKNKNEVKNPSRSFIGSLDSDEEAPEPLSSYQNNNNNSIRGNLQKTTPSKNSYSLSTYEFVESSDPQASSSRSTDESPNSTSTNGKKGMPVLMETCSIRSSENSIKDPKKIIRPPAYVNKSPKKEYSVYDDLPYKQLASTPLHVRLQDVNTPDHHTAEILPAPAEYLDMSNPPTNSLVPSRSFAESLTKEQLLDLILEQPELFKNNQNFAPPKDSSKLGDCEGKTLVALSRSSNV